MSPIADMMSGSGVFGEGRSGDLSDNAGVQDKVLDLSGRRP